MTPSMSPTSSQTAPTVEGNEKSSSSNLSLEPDPILFTKLAGRQEIRIKLKQNEVMSGPKVDLEINLGSLLTFLSPRQLHVLIELLHGLSTPDMEDTRFVCLFSVL